MVLLKNHLVASLDIFDSIEKHKYILLTQIIKFHLFSVDLCPAVPCFHAFFDLLISLGQKGLVILLLKSGSTLSKWPKLAGFLVHSTKSLQSLKRLNIEKEILSIKSDVFLTYESQNACFQQQKQCNL